MGGDGGRKSSGPSTRTAALAAAGVVLVLGLACFVAAVVVPMIATRETLKRVVSGSITEEEAIEQLGGPGKAAHRLSSYARLPERLAPHGCNAVYLLRCCGEAAVPGLRELLKDKYPGIRRAAALSLGQIGPASEEAVPTLEEALWDAEDAEVRLAAAEALGGIGPAAEDAVPSLVTALKGEKWSWRAQHMPALALGRIGPAARGAVPALEEVLGSKDPWMRCSAAVALCRITCNAEKGLPPFLRMLDDEDPDVRYCAVRLFDALGPFAKEALPALQKALKDEDEEVRAAAAEALKRIGAEKEQAPP